MRRLLGAVAAAAALLIIAAPHADAHALVRRSDPASGALLSRAPQRVVITFTERPDPGLSVVHVVDSNGRDVERGEAQPIAGAPLDLEIALHPIPDGVYTVTWRVVSRADGHVTAGSFSFGVGVSPAGDPASIGSALPATPSPSPGAVAGRWAFYWGLALLMGAGTVGALAARDLPPGGRPLLVGSWLLAAAGLIVMLLAERATVDVPIGQLLRSGAGRQFVYRGAALLVLGGATGLAVLRPRPLRLLGVVAAAGVAMLVHALAGHAGAETRTASRWFDTAVQWLHLVAVGVWVGGLPWLLLATRARRDGDRTDVIKRFSFVAGIALATVAVTGTIRAIDELGSAHPLHGLFHTGFGLTLLIKVGLFAGLVALGARNRYVNVPGVAARIRPVRSLRRVVGAEILIAAGILGATGVLSELPPATVIAAAAPGPATPRQVVVTGSDFATSVRVRLNVTPGTVGPNAFSARVTDYDTGRAVPARGVTLRFSLADRPDLGSPSLELSGRGGGVWTGRGTVLALDGTWDVSVLVQESAAAVEVPLRLTPRLPPEDIQVSKVPGQPTIYTIGLPEGTSLQTYVDPGGPGSNTVHFTFFRASGAELPIASATASATPPEGAAQDLSLIRFDAGHFAANTKLDPGHWRFRIQATTNDGTAFSAYFDHTIR